jgi:NAD(P)-dependent dehydrogenase (short-subunit alcohol dehydrogenase family)
MGTLLRLPGKVIAVTGGGSGIGRATAQLAAAAGARVLILDRNEVAATETAQSIRSAGGSVEALVCNVTDARSLERVFETESTLDGLVNSAGVARRFPLTGQDEDGWDAVMEVNVKGAFLCSKLALERMRPGASIVHVASAVALIGVRNRAAYTASKGALVSLTRNMALDYAPRGIRVNCVCPGFARTALTEPIFADPERREKIEKMHPLGRMGEPEDIAKAIVFLLSQDASWITGVALAVDGGFSTGHQHDV